MQINTYHLMSSNNMYTKRDQQMGDTSIEMAANAHCNKKKVTTNAVFQKVRIVLIS